MKTKRSLANRIARECLCIALMKLLETTPLSAITITELTKKAGVSRMTYYRNYTSKEEIFSTYLDDIIMQYQEDITTAKRVSEFNHLQNLIHCFQYFQTHNEFIQCLLKVGMGDILRSSLTNYMITTYYTSSCSTSFYYLLHAYAGSLYNLYLAWIFNHSKESPEEMATLLCEIYKNNLLSM